MDVKALMAEIGGDASKLTDGHEKVAGAEGGEVEPMEKLASELRAAGAEMADSFVDRTLERFEKVAGYGGASDKASSSHASAGGVTEPSNWSKIKEKLQGRRGGGVGDPDAGHTRAEDAYKHRIGNAGAGKGGREGY